MSESGHKRSLVGQADRSYFSAVKKLAAKIREVQFRYDSLIQQRASQAQIALVKTELEQLHQAIAPFLPSDANVT
jgi:hypothetical protein